MKSSSLRLYREWLCRPCSCRLSWFLGRESCVRWRNLLVVWRLLDRPVTRASQRVSRNQPGWSNRRDQHLRSREMFTKCRGKGQCPTVEIEEMFHLFVPIVVGIARLDWSRTRAVRRSRGTYHLRYFVWLNRQKTGPEKQSICSGSSPCYSLL